MAPSATTTVTEAPAPAPELKLHSTLNSGTGDRGTYRLFAPKYNKEAELAGKDGHAKAKVRPPSSPSRPCVSEWRALTARQYANYLPTWDPAQKYPPLEPFEHVEHGKDADPSFPNLLPQDTAKVVHLTPSIGTEVRGIQLTQLNDAGKDELARLVAERKVVAFRGQDFADLPIPEALDFGGYFGRHHIHPTSGEYRRSGPSETVHQDGGLTCC